MSSEHLLQPLHQLLAQAESLLVLAQQEDWLGLEGQMTDYLQKVALLEDRDYLASIRQAGMNMEAQGLILQIQGTNQEIDKVAQESHEKVASELRQIIQSGKALDAYGQ